MLRFPKLSPLLFEGYDDNYEIELGKVIKTKRFWRGKNCFQNDIILTKSLKTSI